MLLQSALPEQLLEQLPEISPSLYNTLFDWLPTVSQACTEGPCEIPAEGVASYLALMSVGLIMLWYAKGWVQGRGEDGDEFEDPAADADFLESDEPAGNDPLADAVNESLSAAADSVEGGDDHELGGGESDAVLDSIEELEQRSVAPDGLERGFHTAQVGDTHRRVLFAEDWPTDLSPNPLTKLFNDPTLDFDMSIHFKPKNRRKAINNAEQRAEELRAQASVQEDSAGAGSQYTAGDKLQEAQRVERLRDSMKDGSRPFSTSLYVSLKAGSKEALEKHEKKITSTFQDRPAEISLSTIRGYPIKGLRSVSPIAKNAIADETPLDTQSVLFSGGIGALLASMSVSGELDPGGIEIGEHNMNGMPLIRDPFDSETNYNQVIIGDSGAGKSFNIKRQAVSEALRKEDRMIIMLDPLEGFHGLAAAFDAAHIRVGGQRGFNPLEIEKPTEEGMERANAGDTLERKVSSAVGFVEDYLQLKGYKDDIGQELVILEEAVWTAYDNAGITKNFDTHDNESPTLTDVREILGEAAQDATVIGEVPSEQQAEEIKETAGTLHTMLRPFVSGEYENLGKPSDVDISGNDFVYVDLSPQESSEGGGAGLMMQLLFQILYEKAKTTPKEVIFIIDEAQFMLKDGASLDFLSQRVRHSRHFDMSIRFATQNVKDFMRTDQATDIINNAYLTIYHRTNEIHEFRSDLGLSEQQANFIENARSGEDFDYSQALYEINNEYYPVKITATEAEAAVIDHDPTDPRSNLPGINDGKNSPLVEEIADQVQEHAQKTQYQAAITEPPIQDDDLKEAYNTLDETEKNAIELIGWENQIEVLKRVEKGETAGAVVAEYVEQKALQLAQTLGEEQLLDMLIESSEVDMQPQDNSAVADGSGQHPSEVWEDKTKPSAEDNPGGWP